MQTVRSAWDKEVRENLFSDDYGILKLAADLSLTKTPASSKRTGYLPLKWGQWKKRVLAAVKQLCQSNTIRFSDFTWLEPEILTYKIMDKSHVKTAKKADILFKRRTKKVIAKNRTRGMKRAIINHLLEDQTKVIVGKEHD